MFKKHDNTLSTLFTRIQENERLLFWSIFAAAFVLRVIWAVLAPNLDPVLKNNPLHGDAISYFILAENMINGHGFAFTHISPTAFRMPGYPIFLVGIFTLFDENLVVVRLIQALLGALTVIPVCKVGRKIGGSLLGLLAGLGCAFHPILVYMVGWIYSETLYILILWLAMWALVCLIATLRISKAFTAGCLFGIASLIRPEAFLFPTFALFVLMLFKTVKWPLARYLATAQLLTIACIVPWALRNYAIFNDFIPLTTSAGLNFQAGNNPESNGGSAFQYPPKGELEPVADRMLMNEGISWIRMHPTSALANIPKKIFKFYSPIEFETRSQSLNIFTLTINIIYWFFWVVGLYGFWKLRRNDGAVVIFSLFLFYLLTAIAFFGGSRVALPIGPALIIFASGGILHLVKRVAPADGV